ncbi:hypothetical protein NDU88_005475, partial [Pleurodeles waltl]
RNMPLPSRAPRIRSRRGKLLWIVGNEDLAQQLLLLFFFQLLRLQTWYLPKPSRIPQRVGIMAAVILMSTKLARG